MTAHILVIFQGTRFHYPCFPGYLFEHSNEKFRPAIAKKWATMFWQAKDVYMLIKEKSQNTCKFDEFIIRLGVVTCKLEFICKPGEFTGGPCIRWCETIISASLFNCTSVLLIFGGRPPPPPDDRSPRPFEATGRLAAESGRGSGVGRELRANSAWGDEAVNE